MTGTARPGVHEKAEIVEGRPSRVALEDWRRHRPGRSRSARWLQQLHDAFAVWNIGRGPWRRIKPA